MAATVSSKLEISRGIFYSGKLAAISHRRQQQHGYSISLAKTDRRSISVQKQSAVLPVYSVCCVLAPARPACQIQPRINHSLHSLKPENPSILNPLCGIHRWNSYTKGFPEATGLQRAVYFPRGGDNSVTKGRATVGRDKERCHRTAIEDKRGTRYAVRSGAAWRSGEKGGRESPSLSALQLFFTGLV